MCGRYTITRQAGLIEDFEAVLDDRVQANVWWKPRFAYCATYEINQYNGGTVDTPAGGAIADGMYRLAYMVNPTSANQDNNSFGDYAEGFRFEGGSYVSSVVRGTP